MAEAMRDPELRNIMSDPIVNQVLNDLQNNPQSAQQALRNPGTSAFLIVLELRSHSELASSFFFLVSLHLSHYLSLIELMAKLNKLIAAGIVRTQ